MNTTESLNTNFIDALKIVTAAPVEGEYVEKMKHLYECKRALNAYAPHVTPEQLNALQYTINALYPEYTYRNADDIKQILNTLQSLEDRLRASVQSIIHQ